MFLGINFPFANKAIIARSKMNFSCIFLLALALFGAVTQAYIGTGAIGYGGVGGIGYNGVCGTGYGAGYGAGYGVGYEGGYGCRTACAPAAVCDSCQCLKTVVRPVVESIPYSCSRRVQSSTCRTSCGGFTGGVYGGAGAVGGACSGYMNSGYLY